MSLVDVRGPMGITDEPNIDRDEGKRASGRSDRGATASRRRRWMMRVLAVVLALSPLWLAEAVLRLGGDAPVVEGVDQDPWVDLTDARPLFVRESPERWSIPESRMNFFRPASFSATKQEGAIRVFVLGGSTVQGRPYSTETSFSTWLKLRLQAQQPDRLFEVVNCGGISYASYRVAAVLNEVLRHEPDLIVLYTGHNEFLEDRTYDEVRSMRAIRRTASRIGSHFRTVQWLRQRWNAPRQTSRMPSEVDATLDHAGGLERYRRDENWHRGVESHFDQTVRRMTATAARAEVPLLLCLPASDLVATPPIKTAIDESLTPVQSNRFQTAWKQARDEQTPDNQRRQACRECLRLDPHHAGAHYVAGRLAYQTGDLDAAITHLTAARDHDVCPLRATSSVIESVSQAAANADLPLVDTVTLFDLRDANGQRRPDGISDPELFVDHVHPTIAGHQRLAAQIANAIADRGWCDHRRPDATAEQEYTRLASQHLQSLGEEYYARGKQRLRGLQLWVAGRAGEAGFESPNSQHDVSP